MTRTTGKTIIVRLALAGLALAAVIQMVPADRTNPPVLSRLQAPGNVEAILRRACYDCHSHETRWPWYSRVAPVSWWIASHVKEARGDLNFSDWPAFDFELQELALRDIAKQVSAGAMPLGSYTVLHPGARLGDDDRQVIIDWARSGSGTPDRPD